MLGISCCLLADTSFISLAAGANGMTALNLVLPVYGLMFAIGAMIGIGSATRCSLQKAAGSDEARHYFSNACWFALLASLVFLLCGLLCPDKVLTLLGADREIQEVGEPYLRTVLLFAPFFLLNYTFTAFVRNDDAPNVAMAATLGSGFFNIIFDYVFMFPMNMGMVGAALVATALLNGVSIGLQPVASSAHGQTDGAGERKIYRYSVGAGLVIACLVVAGVWLFTAPEVFLFNSQNSRELAALAEPGLRLYFLGFLLAAVNIIKSGFFSAVGQGVASPAIALSRGVVSIVVMAVLLSRLLGVTGVWLAFPASEAITWLLGFSVEKSSQKIKN